VDSGGARPKISGVTARDSRTKLDAGGNGRRAAPAQGREASILSRGVFGRIVAMSRPAVRAGTGIGVWSRIAVALAAAALASGNDT